MYTKQSIRILLLSVNVLLLFQFCIYAQPTEQWVNRYNSPGNLSDLSRYITLDNSGNTIVTGSTGDKITTVKYAPNGAELWAREHNSTSACDIFGVAADNSGNIVITGSDVVTNRDMLTIKYDPAGNILWVQRYNGTANKADNARALIIDAANNIYITGYSDKITTGTHEMVTIKYTPSGVTQWTSKIDVILPAANDIKLDPSGNIYICGFWTASNTNAFLAKISASGILQFFQTYDNTLVTGVDIFTSLAINNAGTDVYVTGPSWGGTGTQHDFLTIKYNSAGVSQWIQRYNGLGSGDDISNSIVIDNAGNVYSAGQSYGGAAADRDVAIAKYSSAGTPLGFQRYSTGNNIEGANRIKIDASQNLYTAGFSNSDILVLKYNSALTLQWSKTYNSPAKGNDATSDMILDNSGNLYITGYSMGIGTNYDYLTIKYSQVVGITQNSNEVPEAYTLHQNYPNPFNPSTNIKFDIPKDSDVKIAVYDMLGKEVKILVEEHKQAGSYELNFDASKLSSGMYFYKLTAGSFTGIKKMILIK